AVALYDALPIYPRRGGERLVDLLDRLGLREVQVDRPVARRLEHGRPRAHAAGPALSRFHARLTGPLGDDLRRFVAHLGELLLGVLVGRVEHDRLLELHDGQLRTARGAVALALLEVKLRGLDLGPGA